MSGLTGNTASTWAVCSARGMARTIAGRASPEGPQPQGANNVGYQLMPRLPTGIGIRPGPAPAIGYPAIAVGRLASPAESGGCRGRSWESSWFVPPVGALPGRPCASPPAGIIMQTAAVPKAANTAASADVMLSPSGRSLPVNSVALLVRSC